MCVEAEILFSFLGMFWMGVGASGLGLTCMAFW